MPDNQPTMSEKIVSSLPMSNPKFRKIVAKFVDRLRDQLAAIDAAWSEKDYAELVRLGHWLKGSAGSVGFGDFVEPAREFEQFAKDRDDANLPQAIRELHSIFGRVALEPQATPQPALEIVKPVDEAPIEERAPVSTRLVKESNLHDQGGEQEKIYSSLPVSNPKYRKIVDNFITRLEHQMTAVDSAWTERDYDELNRLGHWLKGSAGSLGFEEFIEPARELEQFASDKDDSNLPGAIRKLRSIQGKLTVAPNPKAPVIMEMVRSTKEYEIPEKLTSRYFESKPRLRPVIGKFISQLSTNCENVETAVANEDFDEIAKFGYWLKASGGSVGFPAFTEPARDLESYARDRQLADVQHTLSVIKQLNSRIVTTTS